jgi:hypothetical protein
MRVLEINKPSHITSAINKMDCANHEKSRCGKLYLGCDLTALIPVGPNRNREYD